MEYIIQQITQELLTKITEKALNGGIHDIDALASDVLTDCKSAASRMIEAICHDINLRIRGDKEGRQMHGLLLKEKERARELHTELGTLSIPRDYYYDRKNEKYVAVLDRIIGIRAYERVGDSLSARMVSLATDVSYAKSAMIASGGRLSRQTVKNHIMKLPGLEKQPESGEKRIVRELHIYADEDHVHMQKPGKEKGKSNRIVPLVTVTEGMSSNGLNRRETIGRMHFVDENFDSQKLWNSVEGYIGKAYDIERIEKIYVHGDGGQWIRNGLENIAQTVHVMDGYHLEKALKKISRTFPGKNVSQRLNNAIRSNDRKKADRVLQSLYDEAEKPAQIDAIRDFGTYLFGHWEEILRRKTLDIPGSCTEAQVSHVLSERFSRDPLGWSKEGLGKLSKLRVYVQNGGRIKAAHFKTGKTEMYSDYAEQVIREACNGAHDWSIFEREPYVPDKGSNTQYLLAKIGAYRETPFC